MSKLDFAYTLKFKANSKEDSIKVMTAVQKLIKNVSPNDLELVANKVESNPSVIETAKKYL